MAIKAILFDKDGTLIDFSGTFGPATAKVIGHLSDGHAVIAADLAEVLGFDADLKACHAHSVLIAGSLRDIAEVAAPILRRDDIDQLASDIDALYILHSTSSLTPFPFTHGVLDELGAMGLPLGIATNDSEEAARVHLAELGLLERFALICGFDSGHGGKPEPGMVLAFASHCKLAVSEIAMVGDSETDMKAARAAGALAIAVASGEAEAQDLAEFGDHVLNDISALPDLVRKLNQEMNA
ncbi:HAD family hydrolase [Pseudahrensia aquimaris]|uniref:phosphoglycolate phosphatase n=1 Tax=Pseudahrensia aquimaris TaxID=744461 RepID=A0ABW3FD33_9HYPH